MNFITKLRNKPERTRKIMLWTVLIIVAAILLICWMYYSYIKIKSFQKEKFIIKELNMPSLEQEIKKINIKEE